MPVVNGFYCRNCADVDLAKKGIDPAQPHPELAPARARERELETDRAVPKVEPVELGNNRPLASGEQGRRLNLYA